MTPKIGEARPAPLARVSYEELTAEWPSDHRPVVSVLCPTFNHEEFIPDALSGFLAQKTSFPFEIIVRDDASTDATAEIVAGIAHEYGNLIRLVVEPVNRWNETKPIGAMQPLARGEFIALCEGDDYWIDEHRLVRQVETLRRHPDAVLVYYDACSVRGDQVVRESKLMPVAQGGMSAREMLFGGMAPLPTMLYRNIDKVPVEYERHMLNFDLFLHVRLGLLGSAICQDGVGAVHRLHGDSAWFAQTARIRADQLAQSRAWIARWLDSQGELEAAEFFRAPASAPQSASASHASPWRRAARRLRRLIGGKDQSEDRRC